MVNRFVFLLTVSFFIIPSIALGFSVPEEGVTPVLDMAEVMSASEEQEIVEMIYKLEDKSFAEVSVVTYKTLEGYPVEDAALHIGRAWGTGEADVNNGLIILLVVDDREWFITSGYGVEGVLPDVLLNRIGENNFLEAFRQGEYATGLVDALEDIGTNSLAINTFYEKQKNNFTHLPSSNCCYFNCSLVQFLSNKARGCPDRLEPSGESVSKTCRLGTEPSRNSAGGRRI
jgi:uncharacterized protein